MTLKTSNAIRSSPPSTGKGCSEAKYLHHGLRKLPVVMILASLIKNSRACPYSAPRACIVVPVSAQRRAPRTHLRVSLFRTEFSMHLLRRRVASREMGFRRFVHNDRFTVVFWYYDLICYGHHVQNSRNKSFQFPVLECDTRAFWRWCFSCAS